MGSKALIGFLAFFACFLLPGVAQAKKEKQTAPIGWGYAATGPVEVRHSAASRKPPVARLGPGALVKVFEAVAKGGTTWSRVLAVDPATLTPQTGWIESNQIETLPLSRFPSDAELLKQLGAAYLDDFIAAHTALARFLVRRAGHQPALVCFLGSPALSQARLQAFDSAQGKFIAGPYLEFPNSGMQSGITALEVRDLVGDGNECLISHEPFSLGPENDGVNLMIRRIEGNTFKTLWKAPIEFRNLASFPAQPRKLEPSEKNIGASGTVTKGSVEFRPRGKLSEPVWKGKIEFHILGREEPVETVTTEKVCAWDGTKFAPLR